MPRKRLALNQAADVSRAPYIAVYVRGIGTVSSGSLVIEEASEPDYAGTWSPIGSAITATTVSGDKELVTHLAVGAYCNIRVREATAVAPADSVEVYLERIML